MSLRSELRPVSHAATALIALGLGALPRWGNLTGAALGMIAAWIVIPRTRVEGALRRPGERFFGGIRTYPLAVALLVIFLPATLAAVAWMIMAAGDAAASLVGRHVPAPRFFGNRKGTWSGTPALFVAGSLFGWGAGAFVAATGGTPLGNPAHVFLAAGAATLVDLIPLPIDDNLPIAAAAGLTLAVTSGLVSL